MSIYIVEILHVNRNGTVTFSLFDASQGDEGEEGELTDDQGKHPAPRRPYYRGGRGFYRGFYQGGPRRPPRYQNAIMDGPGRQPQFRRPYWRRGYRRYYAQVSKITEENLCAH